MIKMKNIGVILAGGVGQRFGEVLPKQFLKVAGKTIIEHSIDAMEQNEFIDEICVVVHPLYINKMEEIILKNSWRKVTKLLRGGDERYMSSLAAIQAYESTPEVRLIFHDAVRPLVSQRIINDVVKALDTHSAIDVAVPATDTIIQVDKNGDFIEQIPVRQYLRCGQTPQAFWYPIIKEAYDKGLQDPAFRSTDDCGVVTKYLPDVKVYVVPGEDDNMKLTYPKDVFLLDKLFQVRTANIDEGVDFSGLKDKVLAVFGGNSGIGASLVEKAQQAGAKVFVFSRSVTQTDVADRSSVRKALQQVLKEAGKIDYVVNSAALLSKQPLLSMSEEEIQTIIRTNYDGVVNVALESYEALKQTRGQLLFYTSSSYTRGRAFYSLYSSTKAAVVNFVQAIAQEWEPDGIRINVINPERTATPMRTKNFGIEPKDTLLDPNKVADYSLRTLLSNLSGQVIDVRR